MKASNYQCVNCQLQYSLEGDYMAHYKSEHHRYNVKRKLIGLPPLSFEEYHLQFDDEKTSKNSVAQDFYCEICSKKFMNAGTYKQHLGSKKHRQKRDELKDPHQGTLSKSSSSSDFSLIGAQKVQPCVFCHQEGTPEHLGKAHSFPPFADECFNLQGLLGEVRQKIAQLECIYCHLKFTSLESVKQHMTDLSHNRLNINQFGPFEKYYLWKIAQTSSQQEQKQNEQFQQIEQSNSQYQNVKPMTLEQIEQRRLERITFTTTGVLINNKQVGYRHLKKYYKQYLNRQMLNLREKYQPAIEYKSEWKRDSGMPEKAAKLAVTVSHR